MYSTNFAYPNVAAVATGPYGAPPGSQNHHHQHQQHQHQQHQQQQPGQPHLINQPQPPPPPQQQHQQPPQHHHQHQHQQQHPQHPQHPQHHQQHMMYNPQQFPMGPQPPPGGFPGAPNMMPGAGPAGMMQNTGMQHMAAANGQIPNYQTPYNNTPYGAAVAAQMNMPPGYAMGGGMPMPGFPMHPGMTPQQQQMMQQQHHHQQQQQQQQHQHQQQHQQQQQQHQQQHQQQQQRMQPPQPNAGAMSTPTPPRSFQSQPQGTPTPNNLPSSQPPQIPTPQNHQATPQSGTPSNAQQPPQHQPPTTGIQTPQTPTFPSSAHGAPTNGASSGATPHSPGGDSKDKEKFALILEINNELLLEALQIQQTQQALKKERTLPNGTDNAAANGSDNKPTEDEELLGSDYIHCMRRLQSNLSYLAALTNRKDQIMPAPCPAYLKPPPLNTNAKVRPLQGPDGSENKVDPTDREATAKYLQELYKKLQALFPGVDPNKEPAITVPTTRPGGQVLNMSKPGSQTPSQASPITGSNRTPKMATIGPPQQPTSNIAGP